ncbi:hypothetical protein ACFQDG_02260 [Natronoarchaeum mannanilyticum]|uniref:Uncharacterized protein n=1 Tax=Natronoarchaeum mannanilyticum TaxID=926360 RepID=A0AAV3TBX5_9EURY
MATRDARNELPTWAAGLILALLAVIAAYVIVFGGHLAAPIAALFWVIGVVLSLFTLYLLYRFVVAVETIAEKL